MCSATVSVADRTLLVEPNGFGVIGNGAAILAFGKMCKAAIVIGEEVVWIEPSCLIIVANRSVVYGESHSAWDKDGNLAWIDACGDEKYSKESDASIGVDKDGYIYWVAPGYRDFCTFNKIEAVKGSEITKGAVTPAYSVHAERRGGWCDKIAPPWTENLELQMINDELVITELPEG
jgi:hypothetical protein